MCSNILELIYTLLVNCIKLIVILNKMCFEVKWQYWLKLVIVWSKCVLILKYGSIMLQNFTADFFKHYSCQISYIFKG